MWAMAWRNLWRSPARSWLTLGVVALAVFLSLVFFAFSAALKNGVFELLTRETGHLVVQPAGWRTKSVGELRMEQVAALQQKLLAAYPEAEVSVRLETTALLAANRRSRTVLLQGLAVAPSRAEVLERYLSEGRLPVAAEQVALGRGLARALRLEVGDRVRASVQGSGLYSFEVVGLLDYPDPAVGGRLALLPLAWFQQILAPGAATRVDLHFPWLHRLDQAAQLEVARERLQQAVGQALVVETWQQVSSGVSEYLDILDPYLLVFMGLFFILAGMLLVNTIYLGLVERVREFGLIMALGASRAQVMGLVLLESLGLTIAGSMVGLVLGLALVAWWSQGLHLPAGYAEMYAEFGLPVVMYASIEPGQVLFTLLFSLATALLSALWPAWVAGRLQPIEAMRAAP